MFCPQCGKEVKEGVKFCENCGWAVPTAPVQNVQHVVLPSAAPTAMPQNPNTGFVQTIAADEKYCLSCGSVIKKAAAICPKCGVKQSANIDSVSGNTGRNKLVLIALIVTIGIWFVSFAATIIFTFVIPNMQGFQIAQELKMEAIRNLLISLAVVVIPSVLSFLGWIKNNRTMVLIAGIIYIFLLFGVPSGILCLIAYFKMNKPA